MDITDVDLDMISENYINNGMDTSQLEVPMEGPITRSKGKLVLDNIKLDIDESINQHPRNKKLPYNQVKYKDKYVPPAFKDPITSQVTNPRHSERLKKTPGTTWTASRTRKTMTVNGLTTLLARMSLD